MRDYPLKLRRLFDRAIFVDRDGTINVDTDYPSLTEELRFYPRSLAAMAALAQIPAHIIVVTNQAGIALGRFSKTHMSRFNSALRTRVSAAGGRIDAFYYCPHLEAKDLGADAPLCDCSKPKPGMLLEAARDFHIDLTASVLVGDKTSDVAAGAAVGCYTILVETGKGGNEKDALRVTPNATLPDLAAAAEHILEYLRTPGRDYHRRRA